MVKYLLILFAACSCFGQAYTYRDQAFIGNIHTPEIPLPLTNYIRSYWRVDEGSGTLVHDRAKSDGATIIPGGWTAPLRLPLYLGASDMWTANNGHGGNWSLNCGTLAATIYSYTNNDLNLGFVPKWTICMWACHTNTDWSASFGNTWLSSTAAGDPYPYPDFRWFMRVGTSPYFQLWHPASHTIAGVIDGGYDPTLFPANTWVWLGLSRSNNVYTFFTNGAMAKIVAHDPNIVVGQQLFPQKFQIGGEIGAGDVARWQGRIGEVIYYYGTNLNATDISYIYHTCYGMP